MTNSFTIEYEGIFKVKIRESICRRFCFYVMLYLGVFSIMFCTACGHDTKAIDNMETAPDILSTVEQPDTEPVESMAAEPQTEADSGVETEAEVPESKNSYDFTICFAGDVNLDEERELMQFLDAQENGLKDCISEELLTHMNQVDVMCLNNEFTFSLRGEPLEGKSYTFRANPERVTLLQEMGVDIVKLANNHVYDYGSEALTDTLDTLAEAEIAYMGAGRNLEEAQEPVYFELDGKIVAFVAASRAEKNFKTPQATEDSPGVLLCYDTELFLETIKEADKNADFVIAYVHWGTEYSYELEEAQLTTGKEYLDAGADAVIGAHAHYIQGMEYYDGKPIVYGLGNYWFNGKERDTMLVDLHFFGDDGGQLEVKVIPAKQADFCTTDVQDAEERERIFTFLEDISVNVEIDEEGLVTERVE